MVKFYNPADQELFKKYQYLPQEKYRLGLNLPTEDNEVITDEGIVNTDAFAGSGGDGFSSTGNMFGEGTPVSPVYGSTPITGGLGEPGTGVDPVTGDIVGGGNIVDEFGIDGEVYPAGTFDNLESEEKVKQNFFSKLFNKAGQVKAGLPDALKGIVTLLNPLSIVPTILGNIGGDGPSYGIAGLTDQQKNLYDNLASQGFLFDTSSGYKTMTGKNLMGKGYLEGQIKNFNEMTEEGYTIDSDGNVVKPDGTLASGYLKNKFLEANIIGKNENEDETTITNPTLTPELINEFVIKNNRPDPDGPPTEPPGYTGGGGSGVPDQIGGGNGEGGGGGGIGSAVGGDASPGSEGPGGSDTEGSFARGGRVKYFYGGKV